MDNTNELTRHSESPWNNLYPYESELLQGWRNKFDPNLYHWLHSGLVSKSMWNQCNWPWGVESWGERRHPLKWHLFPALNLGSVDCEVPCKSAHQISVCFYFSSQRRCLFHSYDSYHFPIAPRPGGILKHCLPWGSATGVHSPCNNIGR